MSLGPVEYVLVEFPGSKFTGAIAPELERLSASGIIRIIDLIFITKDADGTVEAIELSAMEPQDAAIFGGAQIEVGNLLTEDDIAIAAESLEPGSSAGLLVWENTWAADFAAAVRASDGRLVAHDRIPADLVEAAVAAAAAGA
jgi:hypothetical protein